MNTTNILNNVCSITSEEILVNAHNLTAVPSLIIGFILFSFILLLTGLIILNTKQGRIKFMIIWGMTNTLSSIIFIFLILSPNLIQTITNTILNLWK